MASHFLLLLLLLHLSNTIIAAANGEFPPHLSFEQYRSVQSFAGDENNKLISEMTSNGWDDFLLGTWYTNLKLTQLQKSSNKGGFYNNNDGELFPFVVCHSDESDRHGVERYNLIDSVLSEMCDEHENESDSKYFMKKIPIYNRNFNNKNKNDNNKEHTLHGACFFASIGMNLARNVEEEGILITPVAPLLKLRKNISGSSEDYNEEESLDKDTISLSVMLAPGIFSSHDEVVEFASNIQQIQDMDQNNSFLSDCDKKPYQRSSINIGFSDTSFYFFYEFKKQDLKAGITHRCHRLFLEHIVTKPQVISVEKVSKNKISNHHARWTVESGTKDYRPFSDITGLNGKGETVFVADTGLDEQHCYLRDYDGNTVESTTGWDLTGKIDRNLRKVIQYIELDDIASDRKDSNGHGTHIVASIVGKRLKNGVEVDGLGDGVANGALISFYDGNNVLASDEDGNTLSISVNSIISQFFYFPHIAEAKIISASWNSGVFGEYDDKTRQVDEYFHNDPDDLMLMFNSAGNEGEIITNSNYGTTKYPCISKNVLCVGASRNYHSDMSEIDVVAFFSSYGPTRDGRIKPDIVSPGEGILSANAGLNGCGPDTYPESIEYGINHGGLVFKRGTSMACPIAAGAGALVRQYFADGYYPSGEKGNEKMDVTGSLLKAILVNGAVELKHRSKPGGGYEDSEYYDRYQGFGRINLLTSLNLAGDEDSPNLHVENEMVIEKGQTHEYLFVDVCNDHEFRVTLAWRDPPSDSGCAECLVNDLDLEVLFDGKTYYPNGRDDADETNNVERVILKTSKFTNPSGNTIHVKVKTANLGADVAQKYSLASTGCFGSNEVELIGSDSGSKCEDDEFEYVIDIFTNRKPEETSWILKKQGSDEVIAAVIAGEYEEKVDWLQSFRQQGCITKGCYIFIIKDTAFDGLCCDKGMGSYSIRGDDDVLIESDSFVDRQKIEKFCYYGLLAGAEPTTSPTVLSCNDDEFKYQIDIETDLYPDETRWILSRKPRIDGVDKGNYTASYREYIHEGCLDLGLCYSFFVNGRGEYSIKANEFVVAEREYFASGTYEEFSYAGDSSISPTYGIRTSAVGSNRGEKFDDVHSFWENGNIKKIELYVDDSYVRFIGITYESGQSFEHGFKGGTRHIIITLDEDQNIIKVSGQSISHIYQLIFETNDGEVFGPYGGSSSYYTPFEFDFGGNALVYIFGRFDIFGISQIGFAHASLPQKITDSPTSQPTSFPCGDNQFRYEIIIRTDSKPWDIWWELHSIVDSIPFMTYRNQLESYSHTGCAAMDENYEFLMIDKKRDGLCCYFGSGSYTLSVDDNDVVRGNHFDDATHFGYYWAPDFVYNKHEFSYSSTLQPTSNPIEMKCSDDKFEYRIRVRTDYHPYETSWKFKYSNGDIIKSVEIGEYFLQHYEHNHRGCLPLNECFTFYISTYYGHCCFFGNGGYTVFANDIVMAEGAERGRTKTFCYGPSYSQSPSFQLSSSPSIFFCNENEFKYEVIVTTAWYPEQTSWELSYTNGTIIDSREKGYYTEQNTEHVDKGCIDFDSCVIFKIFDGMCCFWGNVEYTIMANDDIVAEGETSYNYEPKTFCYGPSYSFSPSFICASGSNNDDWCGFWASLGLCEDNHVKDWMQENCAKACSNCCMDYSEYCDLNYHDGRCTDTSPYLWCHGITWQDWMRGNCRYICDTCDLDFTQLLPTPPSVICSDDQFKYEIIVTNDDDEYFAWDIRYKYPDLIDGRYEMPEGYYSDYYYGVLDGFSGWFPPNYEKRFYGCASYLCFNLLVQGVYAKIYNKDKDILIAKNTEKTEDLRFCHYTEQPTSLPTKSPSPTKSSTLEAIFTIFLEFSTSQSNAEDVSKVVQRSVTKILFNAQIENVNVATIILDSSCEEESKICDIVMQVCTDICGEGEEPDFLAFVGNTMKEVEANGQLLQTIKATADHMDVGIVDSHTQVSIFYTFEYDTWPTISPTTLPSSTPTQNCDVPDIVQNLFGFISSILSPVTQAITNTTDPISDILFGVESYNSIGITTCKDKMFELYLEIKTDDSPDKTSWELLYENGTMIDSIGQETYSEYDTVYSYSYCLDTSCFVFNMFDLFEFKGSYNITVGDTVLAQQDSFLWWRESKRFCYPQFEDDGMFALQIELITDDWPQETSWDLTFDNGTLVDHVDERYYTGRNIVYNHRYCLFDGCYDVTFHDHMGDGMCCSYGSGSFKMKINDKVIREGSEFGDSVRKSFCHIITVTSDEENNSFLFAIITDLFGDEICCTMETTGYPTPNPTTTSQPSISSIPSSIPSSKPSISSNPSVLPSSNPSSNPSFIPTTLQPWPSTKPASFCNEDEFKYEVIVTTDEFPSDLLWKLVYDDGTLIDSIEEGEYTYLNYEYVHNGCIDLDSCVFFEIHRYYEFYFDGKYTVIANNDLIMVEGGDFLYNARKAFCFGPSYPRVVCDENEFKYKVIVTTAWYPEQTSWELNYTNGTIIDSREEGYYTERATEYFYEGCLGLDSCVIFVGNGVGFPGKYTLKANDVVMAEGGQSIDKETTEFCYPVSSNPSFNPTSTSQPSSQPSLQPTFKAPPPVNDYKIWLDGDSWDGIKWLDKSTNEHHSASARGTINTAVDVESGMKYLYGDTISGVTLTSGWPSGSEYTFFHVTKYNGPTKERIWSGTTGNWLSGHAGSKRGVFNHQGWITQSSVSFGDADSWGVFTDRVNSSGSNVRVDGVDVTTNSSPKYIPGGIGINNLYSWALKKSDWAAALVLVYDRYLDEDEVLLVEDWIRTEYLST